MNSSRIFQDGGLRQGVHKIQNPCTETDIDIGVYSRAPSSQPEENLGNGDGPVVVLLPVCLIIRSEKLNL